MTKELVTVALRPLTLAGVMAAGICPSLSDSSLLLSEFSIFLFWAWVAVGPVFLAVPSWPPFLGDSLAGAEAALT